MHRFGCKKIFNNVQLFEEIELGTDIVAIIRTLQGQHPFEKLLFEVVGEFAHDPLQNLQSRTLEHHIENQNRPRSHRKHKECIGRKRRNDTVVDTHRKERQSKREEVDKKGQNRNLQICRPHPFDRAEKPAFVVTVFNTQCFGIDRLTGDEEKSVKTFFEFTLFQSLLLCEYPSLYRHKGIVDFTDDHRFTVLCKCDTGQHKGFDRIDRATIFAKLKGEFPADKGDIFG